MDAFAFALAAALAYLSHLLLAMQETALAARLLLQQILAAVSLETKVLLVFSLFVAAVLVVSWSLSVHFVEENSLFPCEVEEQDVITPEEAVFLAVVRVITTAAQAFFDVADYFEGDYSLFPCEVEDPPAPPKEEPGIVVPEALVTDLLSNSQVLQAEVTRLKEHVSVLDGRNELLTHTASDNALLLERQWDETAAVKQNLGQQIRNVTAKKSALQQQIQDKDVQTLVNEQKKNEQLVAKSREIRQAKVELNKEQEDHTQLQKEIEIVEKAYKDYCRQLKENWPVEYIERRFDYCDAQLTSGTKVGWVTELFRTSFKLQLRLYHLGKDYQNSEDTVVSLKKQVQAHGEEGEKHELLKKAHSELNIKLNELKSKHSAELEDAQDERTMLEDEITELNGQIWCGKEAIKKLKGENAQLKAQLEELQKNAQTDSTLDSERTTESDESTNPVSPTESNILQQDAQADSTPSAAESQESTDLGSPTNSNKPQEDEQTDSTSSAGESQESGDQISPEDSTILQQDAQTDSTPSSEHGSETEETTDQVSPDDNTEPNEGSDENLQTTPEEGDREDTESLEPDESETTGGEIPAQSEPGPKEKKKRSRGARGGTKIQAAKALKAKKAAREAEREAEWASTVLASQTASASCQWQQSNISKHAQAPEGAPTGPRSANQQVPFVPLAPDAAPVGPRGAHQQAAPENATRGFGARWNGRAWRGRGRGRGDPQAAYHQRR